MKTYIIDERERLEEILNRCDICFVGITDLEGNPYVIPMNFGYQDGIIYLHSGPAGSSLDMLAHHNQVCISFCTDRELICQHPKMACSYRMKAQSVLCRGQVTFLPDHDLEAKRAALDILMRHYTDRSFVYSDPAVRNVKIWKVEISDMTGREYAAPFR